MAAAVAALALASAEDAEDHRFEEHQEVPLVANKVGPYSNPHETYPYYSLPFCPPKEIKSETHELGELLSGDRKVNTPYELLFRTNEEWRPLCTITLTPADVAKFEEAVAQDYYFEMFLDDLPILGYVGFQEGGDMLGTEPSRKYLFTHMHFDLEYNGNYVVAANVTLDKSQHLELIPGEAVKARFSYSSTWRQSHVRFDDRMEQYHERTFLPPSLEIHWLSIVNSLVLALLLMAFLAIIMLRIVKNDFTRYMNADEEDLGEEETGWKLVHGDVFRMPAFTNLMCALVGTGAQLFVMSVALLGMALLGLFAPTRRGAIVTACIVLYSVSAGVGGYLSARLYRQLGGDKWVLNILLTSVTFPGPLLLTFAFLNTTAIAHASTSALPFGTIVVILLLYGLVTFPLTVLGGIAGRNTAGDFDAPCRTTKVPREIPEVPVYRSPAAHMLMAGFLPFSAISIELHYVFASVWGQRVYTLYGILFLAFTLLTLVTSLVVISLTYFQLAVEDWRWWWRSFLSGGMVGFFIYGYCLFYYFNHSDMTGFLQTSFYFGYMANVAYGFFLMMGFVGFFSSMLFVRYIYARVKIE